jgi:hypothetical protein
LLCSCLFSPTQLPKAIQSSLGSQNYLLERSDTPAHSRRPGWIPRLLMEEPSSRADRLCRRRKSEDCRPKRRFGYGERCIAILSCCPHKISWCCDSGPKSKKLGSRATSGCQQGAWHLLCLHHPSKSRDIKLYWFGERLCRVL